MAESSTLVGPLPAVLIVGFWLFALIVSIVGVIRRPDLWDR